MFKLPPIPAVTLLPLTWEPINIRIFAGCQRYTAAGINGTALIGNEIFVFIATFFAAVDKVGLEITQIKTEVNG